jgi:SAM-dependent methyltransferase
VIGLGSGETAWAAACRWETRSVAVFEILAPQPRLLAALAARDGQPVLRRFLRDGRVRVTAADGRNAIERGEGRYDVIQVDALRPTNAYSGNVYSVEFFARCARKLAPGGLLCTQVPTRRVAVTFAQALPHVLDFGGIMVGSNDELPVDVPAWAARLQAPPVVAYFGREVVDGILARLQAVRVGAPNPRSRLGLNRDLFPRDEFSTPPRRRRGPE